MAVRELQSRAQEAAAEALPRLLPAAFIGMRDDDPALAAVWAGVWDEGAQAGESAAIAVRL